MNELIIAENGFLSPEISLKIAEYETKMKALKEQEESLKEAIKAEMEAKGIIKLENDDLVINYIQPTDRETFDSKKLKADNPDLYDEYVKITKVKASIRVKVKK